MLELVAGTVIIVALIIWLLVWKTSDAAQAKAYKKWEEASKTQAERLAKDEQRFRGKLGPNVARKLRQRESKGDADV